MGQATASAFDTVVLAGGRAVRMGGADKPALTVAGTPMLVLVARAAAAAGTARLIVVGLPRTGDTAWPAWPTGVAGPAELVMVCEQPTGGGPVPALRRGLAEVTAPWVALLAADLPFLTGADLAGLLAAARPAAAAGAVLCDADGQPQWLIGCWAAAALRTALAGYAGKSLRGLLGPLRPVPVRPAGISDRAPWLDCDTPEDLARARAAAQGQAAAESSAQRQPGGTNDHTG